jgi:hypothetical protein
MELRMLGGVLELRVEGGRCRVMHAGGWAGNRGCSCRCTGLDSFNNSR